MLGRHKSILHENEANNAVTSVEGRVEEVTMYKCWVYDATYKSGAMVGEEDRTLSISGSLRPTAATTTTTLSPPPTTSTTARVL